MPNSWKEGVKISLFTRKGRQVLEIIGTFVIFLSENIYRFHKNLYTGRVIKRINSVQNTVSQHFQTSFAAAETVGLSQQDLNTFL